MARAPLCGRGHVLVKWGSVGGNKGLARKNRVIQSPRLSYVNARFVHRGAT